MKSFLPLITTSLCAQPIEIKEAGHPYFDIVEWKGMGGLLLSKDPSGNSKQINITLVGDHPTSIWDQKFTQRERSIITFQVKTLGTFTF